MFAWFHRWWQKKLKPQAPRVEVILYTRRGCHLCEEVWRQLEASKEKYGLRLQSVDVDEDPSLRARFGLEVPVVAVNGRVRFRGRINPILLERLLEVQSKPGRER